MKKGVGSHLLEQAVEAFGLVAAALVHGAAHHAAPEPCAAGVQAGGEARGHQGPHVVVQEQLGVPQATD